MPKVAYIYLDGFGDGGEIQPFGRDFRPNSTDGKAQFNVCLRNGNDDLTIISKYGEVHFPQQITQMEEFLQF